MLLHCFLLGPVHKNGLFPQGDMQKTNSVFASSYQLEIAFGLEMEICVHFSFQSQGPFLCEPE